MEDESKASRTLEGTTEGNGSNSDLSADEQLLRAQGHKGELPRQFSAFATLALAFSITNSWIGYSATFITPLYAGGGPTVFFGLLASAVACSLITSGLAELASAFPSSGGQYHFAFMVASPKTRAVTAYIAGWLSVIAWILTTASAAIYCAQLVTAIASFWHPDYVAGRWQIWLIYAFLMVVGTGVVCYLPRAIPKGEMFFFLCSLIGFFVFLITVLAVSHGQQSAHVVFTDFENQTGWSDGFAFMLGLGTCLYGFLGTDSATHIAEEVPDPGRNIPRVMWLTIFIGFVTSVPWTIAFLFSTSDLTAVSLAAVPILEVYYQALKSQAGATVFACWLLFVYYGATISCIATSGRLAWAFARDNGLPFSQTFAKVHTGFEVPINATFITSLVVILYGIIYIGSTTAFNSFISMSILSLNVTYVIPQAIVLVRGREKVLPKRHFDLGPYFGRFCNAFSVLFIALYTVLFCFPTFVPPTVQDMNYVSVVVAGIVVIIIGLWFFTGKRKSFVGPDVRIEGIEEAQERSFAAEQHGRDREKAES